MNPPAPVTRTFLSLNSMGSGSPGLHVLSSGVQSLQILEAADIQPPFDDGICLRVGASIEEDLKQTEEALMESEERYRDLFENATDLIQSITPDGGFVYVNRAWKDVLGYSDKEISQITLWDIIHPDSLTHCQEVFNKVIAGETIKNVEATIIAKTGDIFLLKATLAAFTRMGK